MSDGRWKQAYEPRRRIAERLACAVVAAGRPTEHTFEGLPVFFNDTCPEGVLACFGGSLEDLSLHGREDAYRETMADDEAREATRRMVRMIREGLRRRQVRERASLN